MSADVSETSGSETRDESIVISSEIGRGDTLTQDVESTHLENDSDEFTDWSEDDSQNLDDDLESNFSEKRYSGDGEEQPSGLVDRNQKQVDDDEDRKNPAYVPRKGSFFEHDLRRSGGDYCHEVAGVRKIKEKQCEPRGRGLWSCDRSRWEHDRFDERSQRPKSVHELVTIYGFNIRKDSRIMNTSRRYGLRSKIRAPFTNGASNKRSPSILPRKVGRGKKDSLQTFIIVQNKGDGVRNKSSHPGSAESGKLMDEGSLDFEDIRRTNRFIEEPIICFAPKRGEKVETSGPPVVESQDSRPAPFGNGADENEPEHSETLNYPEEFIVGPEIFRRGKHFGIGRKKKFFAGSGRIAPVLSGRGKKFHKNNYGYQQNEEIGYSSDETDGNLNGSNFMDKNWRGQNSVHDQIPEDHRGYPFTSQFRGAHRNGFRGRYRSTGRARNYYYDGTFPQDVRLIVMCGDGRGETNSGEDTKLEALSLSAPSGVKKSMADKPSLITSQGGLILDILPPVTCCARTRSNRNSADSAVYSVAKTTDVFVTSATTLSTCANSLKGGDGAGDETNGNALGGKEESVLDHSKEITETNVDESLRTDLTEDKKTHVPNDKRYSTQRSENDGKARNRSSFNPRFPVPPRNRIFHPNAFNTPAASSFLPAAFILPTGPMFPGPQRHTSMPHMSSSVGRNNLPPMLGLNSHHNPSSHAHQLLALPVRVTPVPFILASSQSISLPSSQHLPPSIASPPHLNISSSSSVSSQSTNLNLNCATSSVSAPMSLPLDALSISVTSSPASASAVVSRPTSLFHAGPQRNTPHPKHWFRFNAKHCAFLKHVPSFNHHMQFRHTFQNPIGNLSINKPSSSMAPSGKGVMSPNVLPISTAICATTASSSSSSASLSTFATDIVASSKLSPHAAAFESSSQRDDKMSDVPPKSNSDTLYEVIPVHSRYWQRSHKACPIEVRGGTVYFSPELQQFQYRCYSSCSKKGSGNACGFKNSNIAYFNSDGKIVENEKKGRTKKALSIVDPRTVNDNEVGSGKGVTVEATNTAPSSDALVTGLSELIEADLSTATSWSQVNTLNAKTILSSSDDVKTVDATTDSPSETVEDLKVENEDQ